MPKLIIDNQEVDVSNGTKVIDAAEQIGIMIPRFCYHPALGAVGACRVCAVKFVEGPVKGVQMSCMVDAADGMVVSTIDKDAVDFRRYVIEWLMLHHPHDCPVCDVGGQCLLQDMTVSGGHGIRRYPGKKRTFYDQYLGPLVQHEMNRCIQCYRCSRYYQEFSGYKDLGVTGSGNRVYFGRRNDGILKSPFSGNLIDICPTGVYTDKPSRFIGRRWDYERTPSICLNCSVGCHTIVSARYRVIVRQEARHSPVVNGHFICDRGRYGFFYTSMPERPRQATISGTKVPLAKALVQVAERVSDIALESGAAAVACAGSVRSSLQTLVTMGRLSRKMGWHPPAYWLNRSVYDRVRSAVANYDSDTAVSLQEVSQSDFILVVGCDPINEAPMLALTLRQAQREGARIIVLDPRPVNLPFEFQHIALHLEEINLCLGTLAKRLVDRKKVEDLGPDALGYFDAIPDEEITENNQVDIVAATLKESRNPLIICGTDAITIDTPHLAADIISLLKTHNREAGLFFVLPGANAFGAAWIASGDVVFDNLVSRIEQGKVKALIIIESDPVRFYPDPERLERAFASLDLLVVIDYLNTDSVKHAHIFLPSQTVFESGGLFINQEGRLQAAPPSFCGGFSIAETGGGNHPPRDYGRGLPGADPTNAGELLAAIARFKGSGGESVKELSQKYWLPETLSLDESNFTDKKLYAEGIRLPSAKARAKRFTFNWQAAADRLRKREQSLQILTVECTFGTEELSSFSPHLDVLQPESRLLMHQQDAMRLGIKDGDEITVTVENGSVKIRARIIDNIRAGVLVLPRFRQLNWQIFGMEMTPFDPDQIYKA
jgi:NADH-quinone oxidoreductase subunit G